MKRTGYNLPRLIQVVHRRPHRLAAQDGALSRLKQGFESPWGHKRAINEMALFLCWATATTIPLALGSPGVSSKVNDMQANDHQ